jgi:hypothetical protein
MKFKKYLNIITPFLDIALIGPLAITAPIFWIFARIGGKKLPKCRELLKTTGIYPIRDHYYQPLFRDTRLKKSLRDPRLLPGIDWKTESQLNFLKALVFENEFSEINLNEKHGDLLRFSMGNGWFDNGDAEFLYQIVRHLKPQTIIEIGSGNSTKIAHAAVVQNHAETGKLATHISIEPYEMPWLERLGVKVERKLLEDCDLEMFKQLGPNDLLFIDSSHIIRPQGDVLCEYLQIIPNLKQGVVVHVHDIYSPHDYPDRWVREDVQFWNEQYLLEALLTDAKKYEIVAALNYLYRRHFDCLKRVCPYLDKINEPGSFYFKIT